MRAVGEQSNPQGSNRKRRYPYEEMVKKLEIVIAGYRAGKYIDEIALECGATENQVSSWAMELRKKGLALPRLPKRQNGKRKSVSAISDIADRYKKESNVYSDVARKHASSW